MKQEKDLNVKTQKQFPFYRFKGTHRQLGQQFGEACKPLIHLHYEYAFQRLSKNVAIPSLHALEEAALQYRPYVQKYASFFDEEIQGLAEGAGISLGQAYFLQLRAEIYNSFDTTDECTTFAVQPEATQNGIPLIGQNADLPAFYKEIGVVVELIPDDGPSTLMVTPAGQVSYIGINSKGLGIFANFITCDGWRVGFPRYMLSRLGLTKATVDEAIAAVRVVYRASSRNLILLDQFGKALDAETIPKRIEVVFPTNGLLAHSNHFITEELIGEERKRGEDLENSKIRLRRMKELLTSKHGQIDVEMMKEILRDRSTAPHTLCRKPGDWGTDSITFASVIAEPSKGTLWVAVGPPDEYEYQVYSFSS